MNFFRVALLLSAGGTLGLLGIPFLPEPAQNWVATQQSNVSSMGNELQEALRSRSMRLVDTPPPTRKTVGSLVPTPATSLTLGSTLVPTPNANDAVQIEKLIHDLLNKERQSRGITALRQDERLSAIARAHSQDMADRNYFAHEGLLGRGPSERAAQQGYNCRKDYGSYYTDGIAENIFQNWLYSSITYVNRIPFKNYSSAEEIAASTAAGWMQSSGHRQNILNPAFDRVGTGVAASKDEKVYITQDFC